MQIADNFITGNEPFKSDGIFDMVINCTSCGHKINHNEKGTVFRHAALAVVVCKKCFNYYGDGKFTKDENGIDEFCRWCAEGGNLYCCSTCSNVVCKECIRKNLGRGEVSVVSNDKKWQCYLCNPSKLQTLVLRCDMILEYNKKRFEKSSKTKNINNKPNVKFPAIDILFNSVAEASNLFQKSVKHVQKQFRKDVTSAENSWQCFRKIDALLKLQNDNLESLKNMKNAINYFRLKQAALKEKKCNNSSMKNKDKKNKNSALLSEADHAVLTSTSSSLLESHLPVVENINQPLSTSEGKNDILDSESNSKLIIDELNDDVKSVTNAPLLAASNEDSEPKSSINGEVKTNNSFDLDRKQVGTSSSNAKESDELFINPDKSELISSHQSEGSVSLLDELLPISSDHKLISIGEKKSDSIENSNLSNELSDSAEEDLSKKPNNNEAHDDKKLNYDLMEKTTNNLIKVGKNSEEEENITLSCDRFENKPNEEKLSSISNASDKSSDDEKVNPDLIENLNESDNSSVDILDKIFDIPENEQNITSPYDKLKKETNNEKSADILDKIFETSEDEQNINVSCDTLESNRDLKKVSLSQKKDLKKICDSSSSVEEKIGVQQNEIVCKLKVYSSSSDECSVGETKKSKESKKRNLKKNKCRFKHTKIAFKKNSENLARNIPDNDADFTDDVNDADISSDELDFSEIAEEFKNFKTFSKDASATLERIKSVEKKLNVRITEDTSKKQSNTKDTTIKQNGTNANESAKMNLLEDSFEESFSESDSSEIGSVDSYKKKSLMYDKDYAKDHKLQSKAVVKLERLQCDLNEFINVKDSNIGGLALSKRFAERKSLEISHRNHDIDNEINNLLKDPVPSKKSTIFTKKPTTSRKECKTEKSVLDISSDYISSSDDSLVESPFIVQFKKEYNEGKDQNEIAKKLLNDSESDVSITAENDSKKEKSKPVKQKSKEIDKNINDECEEKASNNEDESMESMESDVSFKMVKRSKFKHCKLLQLDLNSIDSSSDNSSSSEEPKIQKKTKKSKKIKIDTSSVQNISAVSSSNESSDISDFDFRSNKSKRSKMQVLSSDSDFDLLDQPSFLNEKSNNALKHKLQYSSSDSDSLINKKSKRKKCSRLKIISGDDESNSDSAEMNNSPLKSGRKNIRKLINKSKLTWNTKEAAKAEKERRKRVAARQKLYNEVTEEIDGNEVVTKQLVLEMNPETKEALISVDPDILKNLKPHQVAAVKFLWECVIESIEDSKGPGSGCILAHCMGLGKTLSVITFLHTLMKNSLINFHSCLVVCPLNTVLNWINELLKWIGNYNIKFFELASEKINKKRAKLLNEWMEVGGICIIGYEMYRSLVNSKKASDEVKNIFFKALIDPGPDIIVCDEGHILRNYESSINKAINQVRTKRRIILTGTPLQNNMKEYHCMVNFVKPQLLGTQKEFANRFMNPIMNGQCADSNLKDVKLMKKRAHILFNLLNGCVQSLDYSCLTKHLKPKFEYVISVSLSDLQTKMYDYYLTNRHEINGKVGQSSTSLFSDYHVFQMISNHPWLLLSSWNQKNSGNEFINDSESSDSSTSATSSSHKSDDKECVIDDAESNIGKSSLKTSNWWTEFISDEHAHNIDISGKFSLLFSILSACEVIGDKMLVFSQSLLTLDLIEDCLAKVQKNKNEISDQFEYNSWLKGTDYFRMDGSINAEKRKYYADCFNDENNDRARLFLISTKAGCLGINLVAANRVIIFDASWNPSHDLQAIFRAYRFGQLKPVYIYRFLSQGTMEEKIYVRQIMKQSISCRIIEEKQMDRHFTAADIADLYTFDPASKNKHATPLVPKDRLFAELIKEKPDMLSYHEHDSLLQNIIDEDLTEEERKSAWAEYEAEKKGLWDAVSGTLGPGKGNFDMPNIIAEMMRAKPDMGQEELDDNVEKLIHMIRKKQQEEQIDMMRVQAEKHAQNIQQQLSVSMNRPRFAVRPEFRSVFRSIQGMNPIVRNLLPPFGSIRNTVPVPNNQRFQMIVQPSSTSTPSTSTDKSKN